jgi:hypothetical protein
MRWWGGVFLGIAMATAVGADEVYLVGGGKISGEVVERDAQKIVVETGPGQLTLPMSRVIRVEAGRSALAEFQERARSLKAGDVAGWVALGRWADGHGLVTQSRAAYQRAVALQPGNAEANAGLGRVQTDGRWLSPEESYRAQGLVPFEGSWVTPAAREAARRERSEADLSDRAAREGDARAREAEARARAAEAEAQQAEGAQGNSESQPSGGIPYWPYVYGGGGRAYRPRPDHRPNPARPVPAPVPARKVPTSSLNAARGDKAAAPAAPQPVLVKKN